jgi:hypothetical protein
VKPEGSRSERSHDPAPDGTVAHPAAAGLWEQLLSRGNLAEALRRVEQNAGAPGIDGMSTRELRPWLKRVLVGGSLSARGGRLPAAAC